jgi:hypothetical protein
MGADRQAAPAGPHVTPTGRVPRPLVGVLLGAVLLIPAGCTSGSPGVPESGSSAAQGDTLPPPPTLTPAATSGPLDAATLPEATTLGPGWSYRVEGADLEDGTGNDSPFQERDPEEIVLYTIPMGCEVRSETPVPRNVLQATYGHEESGSFAVALRLRFADDQEAEQFAADRVADLRTCSAQPDDPFSGAEAPVVRVSEDGERSLVEYRLPGDPTTWHSAATVVGSDVVTLDSDADPALVDWGALGYQSP